MKTSNLPGEISGYTVRMVGNPYGVVQDDWVAVGFDVELLDGDRVVWAGPWKQGLACVGNRLPNSLLHRVPGDLDRQQCAQRLFEAWQGNGHIKAIDKQLHADIAAVIVRQRKLTPSPDDIVYSLLLDGEAYFDACTFEDWCANFGHDTDSRKAYEIWQKCDEIGRTLTRELGSDRLAELRELFVDY